MKNPLRSIAQVVAACALLLGFANSAQAIPTMCLYLGPSIGCNAVPAAAKIVVFDESSLDVASPAVGVLSVVVSIGPYVITINSGTSKPATTTDPTLPAMTLSSNVLRGTGAASDLNIEFSDDGWGPTLGTASFLSMLSSADVNTNSVTWDAYFDPGNVLFGRTGFLSSLGPINGTPGTNSDSATASALLGSPYSLTLAATISGVVTTSAFTSSLTASNAVPEPATALLLMIGALGMGILRRR